MCKNTILLTCIFLLGVIVNLYAQESINICSFNLRYQTTEDGNNQWINRKDSVISMIRSYKLDVIGVQEDSKLHHLRDLREMSDYGVVYGMSGENTSNAEWCSIFYNKQKFSVLSNGTFWLSETPDDPYSRGWDGKYPRNCNWVEFKDNRTCNIFFVFNTHFDHVGLIARKNSPDVIKNKVDEIAGDKPAFIMGDLNAEIGSEAITKLYSYFSQARDIAPIGKKYGGAGTFHSFGSRNPPVQIDFIFVANSDKVKVEQFTTLTKKFVMEEYLMYSSDHYPIYITTTFNN